MASQLTNQCMTLHDELGRWEQDGEPNIWPEVVAWALIASVDLEKSGANCVNNFKLRYLTAYIF